MIEAILYERTVSLCASMDLCNQSVITVLIALLVSVNQLEMTIIVL